MLVAGLIIHLCSKAKALMQNLFLLEMFKYHLAQESKKPLCTSHHQWQQLWVSRNVTARLCGRLETRGSVGLPRWSRLYVCEGHHHVHIMLWTRKEMTRHHQLGNLSCKRTSCTTPGTSMASVPDGPIRQREWGGRTRDSIHPGEEFQGLTHTHTHRKHQSKTHQSVQFQNDPESLWKCSASKANY